MKRFKYLFATPITGKGRDQTADSGWRSRRHESELRCEESGPG